jgi:chromosome segregation ATPase
METAHENHELKSHLSEYDYQLKLRQKDITHLQKQKEDLESQNYEIKETAKEMLKAKKELERKLKETQSLDDLQKSKSQKDVEHLKKESNELVAFILSLEMAKDEEFEKLFKNESYKDEFDQAKKHLQNQSDIVGSLLDRLQKDNQKMVQEIEEYKNYVREMEDKIEDIEQLKKESEKWKQSYERLAVTLKNSKSDESKDMESILTDYESIQINLADLKLECTTKGKVIKDKENIIDRLNVLIKEDQRKISELEQRLKNVPEPTIVNEINTQNSTLLLKLEKDNKKLESELSSLRSEHDQQKESHKSLTQKHASALEKLQSMINLEKAHKTLEIENQSLGSQVAQLQEEVSELKH